MPKGIPNESKLPKDLRAAEVGYNAFYDNQPQVFFSSLNHTYQMRWVRAAREIIQLGTRQKWSSDARLRRAKGKKTQEI